MRSIGAAVAAGMVAVALAAAPAEADAGAGAGAPLSTDGLAYAYVRAAAGPGATAPADSSTEPAPAEASFVAPPNDDFVFRFEPDVPAGKRNVFEAAAGVWSSVLEVEVPIHVAVSIQSFSDPGILGGAAPTDLWAEDPAFPEPGVWYVSAQANQYLGGDADPVVPEIDVVVSADYEFDESLDPATASGDRVSLMTLALHELAHGLGHTSLAVHRPDGTGSIRYQGLPLAFDLRMSGGDRVPLVDLSQTALGEALTSRLLWTGAEGVRADGGFLPEMFAPGIFQPGSSASHLDEGTYGDGLMTPYLAPGELITSVPTLTQAMMADFGWGLEAHGRTEAFVTAVSRDFIRRFPTPTELDALAARLSAGTDTRRSLARAYAFSDEWIEALLDGYYLTTLGRPGDPTGLAHWSAHIRRGMSTAEVAANFFGSREFFVRSGGTNRAWVRALYVGVLGREPDADGWSSWTAAADGGTSRIAIALGIVQAPESRAKRVRGLYQDLLGRDPEPGGLAHWTEVLRNGQDILLAIELAASDEYADRAAQRFG